MAIKIALVLRLEDFSETYEDIVIRIPNEYLINYVCFRRPPGISSIQSSWVRISGFNYRKILKIYTNWHLETLEGNPTRKRPLRKPRGRWEDNIGIDVKEKGVNTRFS